MLQNEQRLATRAPIDDVAVHLDGLLDVHRYSEPESNGLIVRGAEQVTRVAAAVNASDHAIAGAARVGADLLVVHHRSWPEIDLGLVERKHATLRDHGLSLYCAHSALDGAPGIGNPDQLADRLGITVERRFLEYFGGEPGVIGTTGGTFVALTARVRATLDVPIQWWENTDQFGRVAVVTGAGYLTTMLEAAAALGADTYLTGEGTMFTKLYARERGLNLIFGTHYATEMFGVQALGRALGDRFDVPWSFIPEAPDIR